MHILFYLLIALVVAIPQDSRATQTFDSNSSYGKVVMPQLFSTSVLIGDEEMPIEPNIYEVKFMQLPAFNGLGDRVDGLIQGIKKDLPPEYDHYGHEIRRYMTAIGNVKIFTDDDFLITQIRNVRKAQVISNFWKKHLDKEIKEIDVIMEEDNGVPFAVRTAFKQNKITTITFLISLKAWIDANERVLINIFDNGPEIYEVLYPEILIKASQERLDFYNNVTARQIKLKEIRGYHPFAMMVY